MPHQHQSTSKPGLRERLAGRFIRTEAELEADELQQDADRLGGTPIAELADRSEASVCGAVRSVTLRPRVNVPALVVELYDGSQAAQPGLARTALDRRDRARHLPDRARPGDLQERRSRPSSTPPTTSSRTVASDDVPQVDARTADRAPASVQTVEAVDPRPAVHGAGRLAGIGRDRPARRWPSSAPGSGGTT